MKEMKFEWENIFYSGSNTVSVERFMAKVFGGWIVRDHTASGNYKDIICQSESMLFISDPNHEWKIQ